MATGTDLDIQKLLDDLHNSDVVVRREAAHSLRSYGPAALPSLIEATKDEDRQVRQFAIDAIGSIGGSVNSSLQLSRLGEADPQRSEIRQGDIAPAISALLAAIDDPDANTRRYVVDALGSFGELLEADSVVMDALLKSLFDENSSLSQSASSALGSIRNPSSILELMRIACYDEPERVRYHAKQAIRLMNTRAIPHLQTFVNSPDLNLRIVAWEIINSIEEHRKRVLY